MPPPPFCTPCPGCGGWGPELNSTAPYVPDNAVWHQQKVGKHSSTPFVFMATMHNVFAVI